MRAKSKKTISKDAVAEPVHVDASNPVASTDEFELIGRRGVGYTEYKVQSLAGYLKAIEALSEDGRLLWFRGHSRRDYKLQPNLYRNRDARTEDDLRNLELQLNRRFRDRSMPYSLQGRDESSEKSGLQSWWRLFTMQHYGTPTRLLDWSENALTALCFAVLDVHAASAVDESAAVWVVDPCSWNSLGNKNHQNISSVDDHEVKGYAPLPSEGQHIQSFWPVAVYGMHNSPRIAIQQGTFVVFAPGKATPMENLVSSEEYRVKAKKVLSCITIEAESIKLIAQQLRRLGFRHSMLYPDLQGLATDLKNEVK